MYAYCEVINDFLAEFMLGTLLDLFTPAPFKKSRKDYLGPPHSPSMMPFKTELRFVVLDKDQVQALSAICKDRGTTIHGALCAASFFACAQASLSLQRLSSLPPKGITLSCSSPVSLLPTVTSLGVENNIGVYVYSSVYEQAFTSQTRFWEVAAKVKEGINNNRAMDLQMNGMLDFLSGSWRDFVNRDRVKHLPNARLQSIEVSNLGRTEFPAKVWDVEKVWFSQQNHSSGPLFCNSVATTKGTLTCSISIPSPLILSTTVGNFSDCFLECLNFCKSPDFLLGDILK